MSRARESWLRSDDHERFADAMMLCRSGDGRCADDGYCAYGPGTCFTPQRRQDATEKRIAALEARIAKLERLRTPHPTEPPTDG